MDPLVQGSLICTFLLPLKLVVIKDHGCILCLWHNLNNCLLLNSLSLWTAKKIQTRSLPPSKTWTLVKTHCKWVPKLTVISSFIDFKLVLHQVLEACSTNISICMLVSWFIVNKHHVIGNWFEYFHWWIKIVRIYQLLSHNSGLLL